MAAYFFLFSPPALLALIDSKRTSWLKLSPLFIFFICFIGFRHKVGMDWNNYIAFGRTIARYPLEDILFVSEPGFSILSWFSYDAGWSIYGINTFAAILFCYGLFSMCRIAKEPWLALVAATPYLVIVVGMSATRQSIAIGIIFTLIAHWNNTRLISKIIWIFIASIFHLSALFMLVLIIAESQASFLKKLIYSILLTYGVVRILTDTGYYQYYSNAYLEVESLAFYSEGAFAHVSLNAIPAMIYLFFRRPWNRLYGYNNLLYLLSVLSVMSLPLTFFWPTAVDRMALYYSGVPMIVLAGLPSLMKSGLTRPIVRLMIVFGYFSVLTIWLKYANSAHAYIPYKSLIF